MVDFKDFKLRADGILTALNASALSGDTEAYKAAQAEIHHLLSDVDWQARQWELEAMKPYIDPEQWESRYTQITRIKGM